MMRLMLGLTYLLLGGILFALPNMAKGNILFGVPLPEQFRRSLPARRAIALFRAVVAASVLAVLCALLVSPQNRLRVVATAGPFVILFLASVTFLWQNRKLAPAAIQPARLPEASVSNEPERLPWFTWLGAGPFVLLTGTAVFLNAHWASIPARFPVHWGFDGPDRWNERTFSGVYGPLLFAAELCAWLLVFGLAGWFGARRSRFRRIMLAAMIAAECFTGALLCLLSAGSLISISPLAIVLATIVFVASLLTVISRANSEPAEPAEPTPNDCWISGAIYWNRDDAALFVEKRTGLGYTFNFANPWAWVLLAGIVLSLGASATVWL